MKRLTTLFTLFLVAMVASAMPARRGLWRHITLPDGRQTTAQLMGDERIAFWQTADGELLSELPDGTFAPTTRDELALRERRSTLSRRQLRSPRSRRTQTAGTFTGKKKGLIILAQFQNKAFAEGNDRSYYDRVANERGFSEGDYVGSVKDYFLSQSRGQFELDFDVVGPVTVSQDYEYYGGPGTDDIDAHPWQMVVEACTLADGEVDFTHYDWDGDGTCEQVFVLYAGQGQSDSYDQNTIWPHEFELHSVTEGGLHPYPTGITLDGVTIDTYACANELTSSDTPSGIGTICHEFSHCMGLPDLYDVYYNGYFGMQHWDIMANGGYNGNSFVPAGYTSYERMVSGWLNPVELETDTEVSGMKALTDGGEAYIIYNKAHPDEYYLLENRQPSSWDSQLPGSGLLVIHVDYDERVWRENIVNAVCDYRNVNGMANVWNTHQRHTLIHADNDNDRRYWHASSQRYTTTTEQTDAYPFGSNDSLTCNSVPACAVYNANTDGSLYMNRAIRNIRQNDNATVSFTFDAVSRKLVIVDSTLTDKPDLTGAIFYESFDGCIGKGGNDGVFTGGMDIAAADFVADNAGWDSQVMSGAACCARFGSAARDGIVTSPAITLGDDEMELCFKAAPWGRDDTSLTLSASGSTQLSDTQFEMVAGQWTTFTTRLTGAGTTQITFTPGRRFFLDEVVVRTPKASAIRDISVAPAPVYYDLQGRRLATPPARGLYIAAGRKQIAR